LSIGATGSLTGSRKETGIDGGRRWVVPEARHPVRCGGRDIAGRRELQAPFETKTRHALHPISSPISPTPRLRTNILRVFERLRLLFPNSTRGVTLDRRCVHLRSKTPTTRVRPRHEIVTRHEFAASFRSSLLIPRILHLVIHLHNDVAMLDRLAGQLEHYMDLLSTRQRLVASNIANVDTPGYQTQDIDFQSEFLNAAGGTPRTVGVPDLPVKNDGNNVDLDRESRLLAENDLRFQLASNLMRSQIRVVRSAIQGGQGS
jgi:flagellar basal-body rod protein FlgB